MSARALCMAGRFIEHTPRHVQTIESALKNMNSQQRVDHGLHVREAQHVVGHLRHPLALEVGGLAHVVHEHWMGAGRRTGVWLLPPTLRGPAMPPSQEINNQHETTQTNQT